MIEQMYCDGEERLAYETGTPEFDAAVQKLVEQFGQVDSGTWRSVSTPQSNSIYDDQIVSVVFRAMPTYLDAFQPSAVGRKYFIGKGWVYDKIYTFTHKLECQLPYPEGATPMFIGRLVNVFGQPGDADLTRYQCLYFTCKDHAKVEQWSGQSLEQGAYSTFYAATFDTKDNKRLLRMKCYLYNDQGAFSDWDTVWNATCRRRGLDAESLSG